MLKVTLGFDMSAEEIFIPGDKNDDLISQLEFSIIESGASIQRYNPSDLSDEEMDEMIPMNGGEFYIESGMKDSVKEIFTDDLLLKMTDLSKTVLEEILNDEDNDLSEEEIIYYFYKLDSILEKIQQNILGFANSEIEKVFGEDLGDISNSLMATILSTIL